MLVVALSLCISSTECLTGDSIIEHSQSVDGGLCFNLIEPSGYNCLEHTVTYLSRSLTFSVSIQLYIDY